MLQALLVVLPLLTLVFHIFLRCFSACAIFVAYFVADVPTMFPVVWKPFVGCLYSLPCCILMFSLSCTDFAAMTWMAPESSFVSALHGTGQGRGPFFSNFYVHCDLSKGRYPQWICPLAISWICPLAIFWICPLAIY